MTPAPIACGRVRGHMVPMSFASKLQAAFALQPRPAAAAYSAAVATSRREHWFTIIGVPDTVDGRFDVLALVLSLMVLRAQHEDRAFEAALVDRFAEDMDASFREMGVSDLSISKAVGKAVSALGGRVSAYRDAFVDGDDVLAGALTRNLYRGAAPDGVAHSAALRQARALAHEIGERSWADVAEGRW